MLTTGCEDGLRMYVAPQAMVDFCDRDTQLTASQRQGQLTAPQSRALAFQVLELSALT